MSLTAPQRTGLRSEIGRLLSEQREPFPLTKPQLDAAIAAIDDWIEANAVSFNQSLPVAARNNLTARQKAQLLSRVALARFTNG